MFRTLILLFALWLTIRLLRNWLQNRKNTAPHQTKTGKMVRCHYCEIYIPEEDAIYHEEHHYCCNDHRDNENNA